MRDPELMKRAQRAAVELERAWCRWQSGQGPDSEPMPNVTSYVGYSLTEPIGEPRVVLGVTAAEAELLADLLGQRVPVPLPVPPQAPPVLAESSGLRVGGKDAGEPVADRANGSQRRVSGEPDEAPGAAADAPPARLLPDPPVRPWTGPLALAATAARLEAETRIRAAARSASADDSRDPPDTGRPEVAAGARMRSSADDAEDGEGQSDDLAEFASAWGGPAFRLRRRLEAAFGESAPQADGLAGSADDRSVTPAAAATSRRARSARAYPVQRMPRVKRQGAMPGA